MRVGSTAFIGIAVLCSGCAGPAPIPGLGGGFTPAQMSGTGQSLQQAQAASTAEAGRPGDAALSCDAMQAELVAISQDPAYKRMIANMTGGAANLKTDLDAAEKKAASSGRPDVAAGNKLSGQGNTLAVQSAADMQAAMPHITRMQKLTELGQKKDCAFVKGRK